MICFNITKFVPVCLLEIGVSPSTLILDEADLNIYFCWIFLWSPGFEEIFGQGSRPPLPLLVCVARIKYVRYLTDLVYEVCSSLSGLERTCSYVVNHSPLCSRCIFRSLKDNIFCGTFLPNVLSLLFEKIFCRGGLAYELSLFHEFSVLEYYAECLTLRFIEQHSAWPCIFLVHRIFKLFFFIKFSSSTRLLEVEFDTFCSSIDCIMSQWTSVESPDPWLSE